IARKTENPEKPCGLSGLCSLRLRLGTVEQSVHCALQRGQTSDRTTVLRPISPETHLATRFGSRSVTGGTLPAWCAGISYSTRAARESQGVWRTNFTIRRNSC